MYPFVLAAGFITLYFIALAIQRPRPAELLAVVLWAAYAVYEYYVANGTLCDANCNIRVDLVLFLPLLGSAAYLATRQEPRPATVATLYVICLAVVALLARVFGYPVVSWIAGTVALVPAFIGVQSLLPRPRP